MTITRAQLTAKFPIPGLRFEAGHGDLTKAVLETSVSKAEVYLHGAHVTDYRITGQKPILWMSRQSLFEMGKPIRGGVPICFPWFGPKASDPQAPGHGLARLKTWDVTDAYPSDEGGLVLELQTTIDHFQLTFTVAAGRTLVMTLKVALSEQATAPEKFEEALHTYFSIDDISQVSIEGLEQVGYLDKVNGGVLKPATGEAIQFLGECDRVYFDTTATCVLRDPGNRRAIIVSKTESNSTVVWNPWIAKSAKMPDFGDNEWTDMVCIETANVGRNAIELEPGKFHQMTTELALET